MINMTATTLADPRFNSIINKGETTMNAETNTIDCQTTEEHSHAVPSTTTTTIITSVDSVSTNQPVQGISGASYAPMDTSPRPKAEQDNININIAVIQVTRALENLVNAMREAQPQTNAQTDLEEAVSTTLENAQWFKDRVEESCANNIEQHDFDYEIGQNIERYMRNHFDANDHVDFEALVKDRVEDELESIIDGLVEEAVEARLADLLEEKLANANITINF